MRLALLAVAGVALGGVAALAQSPSFDVATIKPAVPSTDGRTHSRISTDTDTGKLNYTNVSLKDVIGQAFKVQLYQISGPAWIDSERFDIEARFAPRTDARQLPLMLQALLADRFKLVTHRETKELPVYNLTVLKGGPKFKPAESASGVTSDSNRTHWHVTAKVTMQRFAEFLTDEAGRPVIDKTGLSGAYNMTLDWAVDNSLAATDSGPSLFTALRDQLGLKLESAKGPVETVVVDKAERTPSAD